MVKEQIRVVERLSVPVSVVGETEIGYMLVVIWYSASAFWSVDTSSIRRTSRALVCTVPSETTVRDVRRPMIAMTTSNSIKVNPWVACGL